MILTITSVARACLLLNLEWFDRS